MKLFRNTIVPFRLLRSLFVTGLLSCGLGQLHAATPQSKGNGNWNNPNIWSTNAVPACGDCVIVASGHIITINDHVNFSCTGKNVIVIKGEMKFGNGKKMNMPCNSRVYVFGGGKINTSGSGNSNVIEICGTVYWKASNGDVSGPGCIPSSLPECSMVMPVEIGHFEVNNCNENVCIDWNTFTENNNAGFMVQRMETDHFVDLAWISSQSGNGKNATLRSYNYIDKQAAAGVLYYRLKQIDNDGSFSYSRIMVVEVGQKTRTIMAFPNPSDGNFTLDVSGLKVGTPVYIRNLTGGTVLQLLTSGENNLAVSGLSSGVYLCMVQDTTLRLVVR